MKPAPERGWLEFLKLFFGFLALILLAILAMIIALGEVKQDSSFGLTYILGALSVMAGMFAQWAFGDKSKDKGDE